MRPGSSKADPLAGTGVVVIMPLLVPPEIAAVGWMDFLKIGTEEGGEHAILLGKVERPSIHPGTSIVVLCGVVRCRLPALRLGNGIEGFTVIVSSDAIANATPIGVEGAVLRARWDEMRGSRGTGSIWFLGCRGVWWRPEDERPNDTWATDGLTREMGATAAGLVGRFRRGRAAAPIAQQEAPRELIPRWGAPASGTAAGPLKASTPAAPPAPAKPGTPQGSLF